jgi:putative ABC transport system permease protein
METLPYVKVIAPRISFSGLVSKGDATISFIGEGVNPAREAEFGTNVTIRSGSDLVSEDPKSAILGTGLAANLGVSVGDKIVLLANTGTGGLNGVEVEVKGLFTTISKAYDDSALRVPLATAQALLKAKGVHRIVLLLDRTEHTALTVSELRHRLGSSGFEVTPWYDLADFYKKTATLFARQTLVVTLIIAVIVVLSISNTLMMSVMERTGEIGTSMALGVTRRRVSLQFLSEGALIGVVGGVVGVVVGAFAALAISAIGIPMPPSPGQSWGYTAGMQLTVGIVLSAFLLAVVTTVLASIYPAWKAAGLVIVDALRFNR